LNEYLAEGDLAATDSLDTDVAGVDDAASQDDDAANDDRSVNVIQNCFATILDTLATNNPRFDQLLVSAECPNVTHGDFCYGLLGLCTVLVNVKRYI